MDDWEIWLAIAAVILGIFCFFAIIICVFRKIRHEKMMTDLIQTRYSAGSRYSFRSFTSVPWRLSTITTTGTIQPINDPPQHSKVHGRSSETRSSLNPHGSGTRSLDPYCQSRRSYQSTRPGRASTQHSMTLEIIKEYEEKESELGLATGKVKMYAKKSSGQISISRFQACAEHCLEKIL
ncbi:unnamed protein product [Allacma fusca]|uniref:Uncharacterized protein n=1 Tax=Allacma fusca TaxID=39272 RepID=A0A8J2PMG2_9HEXA|nr:unnamed protein product [Allacma fusca]